MSIRADLRLLCAAAAALLLVAATACGSRAAADPDNREVPWTYGPTTAVAATEHVQGIGGKSGPAIAKGWQCRLQDGKRLVVRPYELAPSHALFGKVVMNIGMFDKSGKDIETVRSGLLTAENATFTFDLTPAVASRLWDLVIWYRKV